MCIEIPSDSLHLKALIAHLQCNSQVSILKLLDVSTLGEAWMVARHVRSPEQVPLQRNVVFQLQ